MRFKIYKLVEELSKAFEDNNFDNVPLTASNEDLALFNSLYHQRITTLKNVVMNDLYELFDVKIDGIFINDLDAQGATHIK